MFPTSKRATSSSACYWSTSGPCAYKLDLLDPVGGAVEGGAVIDRVHDHDGLAASVVGAGEGTKTFLTGSVPDLWIGGVGEKYLELDILAVHFEHLDAEIDANGRDECFDENVRYILHENT